MLKYGVKVECVDSTFEWKTPGIFESCGKIPNGKLQIRQRRKLGTIRESECQKYRGGNYVRGDLIRTWKPKFLTVIYFFKYPSLL